MAKDRFTSSKASAQLGAAVTLPLGTDAPVLGIGMSNSVYATASQTVYETGQASTTSFTNAKLIDGSSTDDYKVWIERNESDVSHPNVRADLSNATASTINQFREAIALQSFAEHRMLFGGRYNEYLKFLGVNPRDGRLDRPEMLGSGRQTIQFSEVLQTGVDSTDGGLGTLTDRDWETPKNLRYSL